MHHAYIIGTFLQRATTIYTYIKHFRTTPHHSRTNRVGINRQSHEYLNISVLATVISAQFIMI